MAPIGGIINIDIPQLRAYTRRVIFPFCNLSQSASFKWNTYDVFITFDKDVVPKYNARMNYICSIKCNFRIKLNIYTQQKKKKKVNLEIFGSTIASTL